MKLKGRCIGEFCVQLEAKGVYITLEYSVHFNMSLRHKEPSDWLG